jgi:hypothetical protein
MDLTVSKINAMQDSTSSFRTISTVVCMYRKGNEISALVTPSLEYANASVSVPVERETAAR